MGCEIWIEEAKQLTLAADTQNTSTLNQQNCFLLKLLSKIQINAMAFLNVVYDLYESTCPFKPMAFLGDPF